MALKSRRLRRLGLIENWRWPLLVFVLPLYAFFTILFDAVLTGNGSWLWLVTFVSGTVLEVSFVILCKKLFLARLLTAYPSGVIGISFAAVTNIVRNLSIAWLALELGLLQQVDWLQRTLGAAFMGAAFLILYVSVMGSRLEHSATMIKLQALQKFLVQQRRESSPLLNAENSRLLDNAQSLLLPRIERIQELLIQKQAKADTLVELRALVTEQVRPLSAELSSTAQKLTLKPAPAPVGKVPIEFMTAKVSLKNVIRPGMVLLLAGAGQWVMVQLLAGTHQANQTLIGIAGGALILFIAKAAFPAHLVVSRGAAVVTLILLGLLSGVPALALNVSSVSSLGGIAMYSMLLVAPVLAILGFAISASLDSARLDAEQRIQQDNESLSRETALFEQRMWLAKRNWSFVVHGTVQAALTAAITRLSAAEELEQYQIDLALQDLKRAKDALSKTPELDVDLGAALTALAATWQGICNVKWNITERAGRALVRDVNARMCVNEIAKEAVSNAVRHGEAKGLEIEIDRSTDELLVITIANSGRPVARDAEPGVGSRMLDDLTLAWSLTNNRALGKTVLQAQLPLQGIAAGKF